MEFSKNTVMKHENKSVLSYKEKQSDEWKKCDYNRTYDMSKIYEMNIELNGIEENNGSINSFVLESCKIAPALNQYNRYGTLKEKTQ